MKENMMKNLLIFLTFCLLFFHSTSFAGEADVVEVNVKKNNKNSYNFSVTVFHKDTGWKPTRMLTNNPLLEVSLELISPTMLKLSLYVLMTLSINTEVRLLPSICLNRL